MHTFLMDCYKFETCCNRGEIIWGYTQGKRKRKEADMLVAK